MSRAATGATGGTRAPRRWNNAPSTFMKMAATKKATPVGSLTGVPSTMFIGLKDDGRLAVCYGNPDGWSRFRDNWHGAS